MEVLRKAIVNFVIADDINVIQKTTTTALAVLKKTIPRADNTFDFDFFFDISIYETNIILCY